jgi:hypothetical protein
MNMRQIRSRDPTPSSFKNHTEDWQGLRLSIYPRWADFRSKKLKSNPRCARAQDGDGSIRKPLI